MLIKGAAAGANVKLLDFGIAKIRDEKASAIHIGTTPENRDSLSTSTGAIMGTPAYMAPEQIKNSSGVDRRADIYAIGIMLYELLAGQRPFQAKSTAELLGAHLYEDATPPSEVATKKELPARQVDWKKLDAVVLRAMAKTPDARYQDCGALQADLEAAFGQSFSIVRGLGPIATMAGSSLSGIAPVVPGPQGLLANKKLLGLIGAGVLGVAIGGAILVGRGDGGKQSAQVIDAQAEALVGRAKSAGPKEQRALMEAIEATSLRAHLLLVAQALLSDDPSVSRAAVQAAMAIGKAGDTLLLTPLTTLAGQQVGPAAIDTAAVQLKLGDAEGQVVLTALLQSPLATPEVRLNAALGLVLSGKLGAGGLRQALESALRAGPIRKPVRREALLQLGQRKDATVLEQLTAAAQKDELSEAKIEALVVLGLLGQAGAERALLQAAEKASPDDRAELLLGYAERGGTLATTLALPFLKNSQAKVRRRAVAVLGRMADQGHFAEYRKTFLPLLGDADAQVALTAALVLLGAQKPAPAQDPVPSAE